MMRRSEGFGRVTGVWKLGEMKQQWEKGQRGVSLLFIRSCGACLSVGSWVIFTVHVRGGPTDHHFHMTGHDERSTECDVFGGRQWGKESQGCDRHHSAALIILSPAFKSIVRNSNITQSIKPTYMSCLWWVTEVSPTQTWSQLNGWSIR